MRRYEKNFMIRKDIESLKKHETVYYESMQIITDLSQKFKNPKNIEMTNNIKESIELYRKNFVEYVSNNKDSIIGKYELSKEEESMVHNARKVDSLVTDFRRVQSTEANNDINRNNFV